MTTSEHSLISTGTGVMLILLVTTIGRVVPDDQHIYTEPEKNITCYLCHPGFKWLSHCHTDRTNAVCAPCEPDHYESDYNRSPFCTACLQHCPVRFRMITQCNRTTNNKCQCEAPGTYSDTETTCISHSKCKRGYQVKMNGTPYKDTVCEPCPKGNFSSEEDMKPCQPCTQCGGDEEIVDACTNSTDTKCRKKSDVPVGCVLGSLAVVFVLILVLVACYKRRQKNKRNKKDEMPQSATEMTQVGNDTSRSSPDRGAEEDDVRLSLDHTVNIQDVPQETVTRNLAAAGNKEDSLSEGTVENREAGDHTETVTINLAAAGNKEDSLSEGTVENRGPGDHTGQRPGATEIGPLESTKSPLETVTINLAAAGNKEDSLSEGTVENREPGDHTGQRPGATEIGPLESTKSPLETVTINLAAAGNKEDSLSEGTVENREPGDHTGQRPGATEIGPLESTKSPLETVTINLAAAGNKEDSLSEGTVENREPGDHTGQRPGATEIGPLESTKSPLDKVILQITPLLADKDWKFFFYFLIPDDSQAHARIQQVEAEEKNNIRNQVYQMFRYWKQSLGNRASIEEILAALKEHGRNDIINKLSRDGYL